MIQALQVPLLTLEGSQLACGRAYGDQERESILGFFSSQIPLRTDDLDFAAKCWPHLQEAFPAIAEFCTGLAAGADLTIPQLMLLLLHEEIVHKEHCSIIGVSQNAARDGRSVIAQNWDWPATVYCWPRVVRMRGESLPATLTYAFPGLWACAGVNEDGLAIGWSGAGYWPSVQALPGIPTYALIAGLLTAPDVSSALELLKLGRHAGCFIFFLADRTGEVALVEGWPKNIAVARHQDVPLRTNHYLMPEAIAATHQYDPFSIKDSTTAPRLEALRALVAREERMSGDAAKSVLCHPNIRAAYKLEEAQGGYNSMTVDSFCIDPAAAELWVARGLPDRHTFVRYSLDQQQ